MILYNTADGRAVKELPDGRVLSVEERLCNSLLTLSIDILSPFWEEGW